MAAKGLAQLAKVKLRDEAVRVTIDEDRQR